MPRPSAYTALSAGGFLARWLLNTAALFIASAIVWLVRTWLRMRPEREEARAQGRARRTAK